MVDHDDDTAELELDYDRTAFGAYLRLLRGRIAPEATRIGYWQRLPVLRGRPVTQAEIAEVVGVSRNWYRRLERGECVRASVKLLDRLARAFGLTPVERTKFFVLAIPEMGQHARISLTHQCTHVLSRHYGSELVS
jgi:transcriptional regulator with XRE-family HTH domain